MININCSENCKYSKSGKCYLTHITPLSSFIGYESSCAYFAPKDSPPTTKID